MTTIVIAETTARMIPTSPAERRPPLGQQLELLHKMARRAFSEEYDREFALNSDQQGS
jgi:hypothetical protein